MATIYHHLATYFSFPSAILGDKASGWLGCAAHGICDMTREPMWPSGELKNESEMTLELFRPFVKQSAVTSHSPTPQLDGDTTQTDASSSKNLAGPPSKRRCFNSEWAEGREWLKHDNENGIMFCERCLCSSFCCFQYEKYIASVPGLPRFDLPFAFTTIHGIKDWRKVNREGLGAFIM